MLSEYDVPSSCYICETEEIIISTGSVNKICDLNILYFKRTKKLYLAEDLHSFLIFQCHINWNIFLLGNWNVLNVQNNTQVYVYN